MRAAVVPELGAELAGQGGLLDVDADHLAVQYARLAGGVRSESRHAW